MGKKNTNVTYQWYFLGKYEEGFTFFFSNLLPAIL